MTQPMVSLSGLYKIFGAQDKKVLQHVKEGMGKEDLLAQHGQYWGSITSMSICRRAKLRLSWVCQALANRR